MRQLGQKSLQVYFLSKCGCGSISLKYSNKKRQGMELLENENYVKCFDTCEKERLTTKSF